MWQLQAKRKEYGTQWEPLSVESQTRLYDGSPERRYHYGTVREAVEAFRDFLRIEPQLPFLLLRLATGARPFLNLYEVRVVCVVDPTGIDRFADLLGEFLPHAPLPPICAPGKHTFSGGPLGPTFETRCNACGRSIAEIAGVVAP